MRDPDKKALIKELRELVRLAVRILKKYINLTSIQGDLAMDYPLNAGDSVKVDLAYADDVTGEAVTPDAGSVLAELSSSSDTVLVDESQTFLTITAGDVVGDGNTVTVTGTVGGVASTPWVGTYDVVADVVTPPDPTTITGTFETETTPTGATPDDETAGQVFNQVTGNWEPAPSA